MKLSDRFLLHAACLAIFCSPMVRASDDSPAREIFVSAAMKESGNGRSWGNAFKTLQDALAVARANNINTIRIAQGVYYPDEGMSQTDGSITSTFQLPSSICLFGGYSPKGDDYDPVRYPTILSGDLDQVRDDNNDGIVDLLNTAGLGNFPRDLITLATDAVTEITLDGLIITGAPSRGIWGMRSGLVLNNCQFINNNARVIVLEDDRSSPSLTLTATGCRFMGNGEILDDFPGGAVSLTNLGARFDDCLFEDNQALLVGGAIRVSMPAHSSVPFPELRINRCAFKGNKAGNGGGLHVSGPINVNVTNCLFSGNCAGNVGTIGRGGAVWIGQVPFNPSQPNLEIVGRRAVFSNCTFGWNFCNRSGAGIQFSGDTFTKFLSNCIFFQNTRGVDEGLVFGNDFVFNNSSTEPIYASCYAENVDLDLISPGRGNFNARTNFDLKPIFVEDITLTIDPSTVDDPFPLAFPSTGGDLRQTADSPLVNAGDNGNVNGETDLLGNTRIRNATVDLGAFEVPNPTPIFITNLENTGTGLRIHFESDVGPVDVYRSLTLDGADSFTRIGVERTDDYFLNYNLDAAFFILVEAGTTP